MNRRKQNKVIAAKKPAVDSPVTKQTSERQYWRDHPLVVAALSAVGAFTLTTFAFKEIIIPTQIADIQNKIRDLPRLELDIQDLRKSNKDKAIAIEELKRKIEGLQQKDLFERGNPIPKLLSSVVLGRSILDIEENFPQAKIEKDEMMGFWSVDFGYGIVSRGTYYYDETSKDQPITHVLYWLNDNADLSEHFLHDRLVESLGVQPENPRKGFYEWHTKKYSVYTRDPESYIVMDSNSRPGYWPKPK